MTDNDIKKALENAKYRVDGIVTRGFYLDPELFNQIVDLINRLEAENERLKEAYAVYEETSGLKKAKTEAYKEFAERLKVYLLLHYGEIYGVLLESIDNLLKELVGE